MPKHAVSKTASAKKKDSRRSANNSNGSFITTVELHSALKHAIGVLKRVARYKMEPFLARRMHELGERKDSLDRAEHQELLRFVEFWRKRTIDKFEAQTALRDLRRFIPDLDNTG